LAADRIVAVKADAVFRETLNQLMNDFEFSNTSEVIYEAVFDLANQHGVGNPLTRKRHTLLKPARRSVESEIETLASSVSPLQIISCAVS
jgi:hypothetical protein